MNIPTGTQSDPKAPWNEKDQPVCEECESSNLVMFDFGKKWTAWECLDCGHITSDEPESEY